MKVCEIKLNEAVYQIDRVFVGSRTTSELLIDAVVDRAREEIPVDSVTKYTV